MKPTAKSKSQLEANAVKARAAQANARTLALQELLGLRVIPHQAQNVRRNILRG